MSIAKYIDHTILKQDARKEDIERITAEAREYGFASVCVNSCWVKLCHSLLEGTDVKVCTVVGFPLGAASSEAKKSETAAAVADGTVRGNLAAAQLGGLDRRTEVCEGADCFDQ